MENNQDGNGKNKSSTNIYTNKTHNWIKWDNLIKSKINLWEIQDSIKVHKQKIKTWMGNATGNADKKSPKTGKKDKTKEKRWNMLEQEEKATTKN